MKKINIVYISHTTIASLASAHLIFLFPLAAEDFGIAGRGSFKW